MQSLESSQKSRLSRFAKPWSRVVASVGSTISTEHIYAIKKKAQSTGRLLHEVVSKDWPCRHHSPYKEVHALLTYWAETEEAVTRIDKFAKELAELFDKKYGFAVQIWLIPNIDQPQRFLARKLSHFVQEYGGGNNLLIFWYGGAARATEDGGGSAVWFGEKYGDEINSGLIPQILGSAKAEVLTLYDCGHSLHGQTPTSSSVFEHLGANADRLSLRDGKAKSFTESLIQILDQPEAIAYGVSVLDIHRRLVNRRRIAHMQSTVGRPGIKSTSQGPSFVEASWQEDTTVPSPVYCRLSPDSPQSRGRSHSIVLSRIGYPLKAFPYENNGEEFEVELRLRLRNNDIDMDNWRRWIRDAPPEADQVSLDITFLRT